jgi:chorismate-pyruvate lyase
MPSQPHPLTPDLDTLAGLFYRSREQLGDFAEVAPDELPPNARRLLAHNDHMTVTVEEFHRSPVNVRVLDKLVTPRHYARKILLERQSDGLVVQFGIMRVNFAYLSPEVAREIQSEAAPLGRILIEHNVLRRVQLFSLWRVEMGDELRRWFGAGPSTAYGRTAMIDCNEEPAVELVEIVTPLDANC